MIVCTYRREAELRDTLGDLLAQERVRAEILVLDQTPAHEPATDRFLADHVDCLRIIRLAEPNLPNARNEGLKLARAGVVVFVDDDLRLPRDLLRSIREHFADPEVDGLAPIVWVEGEDKEQGWDLELRHRFRPGWRAAKRLAVDAVIGACMAFRREAVVAVGGFDADLGRLNRSASGEDTEFCLRFTRSGRRIWLAPSIRVMHLPLAPGGCEVRTGPNARSVTPHRRAMAYIIMKEERAFRRMKPLAFYRLLRTNVLRRDVLNSGPRRVISAVLTMLDTIRDVRRFVEQRGTVGPR